jgi:hypothetical protein
VQSEKVLKSGVDDDINNVGPGDYRLESSEPGPKVNACRVLTAELGAETCTKGCALRDLFRVSECERVLPDARVPAESVLRSWLIK